VFILKEQLLKFLGHNSTDSLELEVAIEVMYGQPVIHVYNESGSGVTYKFTSYEELGRKFAEYVTGTITYLS
jgi:hypothetical protein